MDDALKIARLVDNAREGKEDRQEMLQEVLLSSSSQQDMVSIKESRLQRFAKKIRVRTLYVTITLFITGCHYLGVKSYCVRLDSRESSSVFFIAHSFRDIIMDNNGQFELYLSL